MAGSVAAIVDVFRIFYGGVHPFRVAAATTQRKRGRRAGA